MISGWCFAGFALQAQRKIGDNRCLVAWWHRDKKTIFFAKSLIEIERKSGKVKFLERAYQVHVGLFSFISQRLYPWLSLVLSWFSRLKLFIIILRVDRLWGAASGRVKGRLRSCQKLGLYQKLHPYTTTTPQRVASQHQHTTPQSCGVFDSSNCLCHFPF